MDDLSYSKPINPADNLSVALQGLGMRSKAIAGNLANINVPEYKRQTVNFEDQLQRAQGRSQSHDVQLTTTSSKHFSTGINSIRDINPQIETDPSSILVDHNNIDIEREMLDLTKTGLSYKAMTGITKKYFEQMKGIIRG